MQKTKVFEQWLLDQKAMIVRYREVEKGAVLAEYNQLKAIVESSDFQASQFLSPMKDRTDKNLSASPFALLTTACL